MNRLVLATVLAGVVSAATLQTSAVTATWTGGNGEWETASNWDIGAVPGPTTNVQFTTASKVSVNSSPTVQSMYVTSSGNSGPQFTLGSDSKLTVSGPVTNFNIVSYSGGAYSFGGNLIAGRKSGWGVQTSNKTTTFQGGAVADIGGIVWVTGYAGNGLVVRGNSFVTCNGYQDNGGTRNTTSIGKDSVLYSKGNITIDNCYPNADYPEPFTVDGGIVTNMGTLVIAGTGASGVPLILKNGAKWRQYGQTTVDTSSSGYANSLQVLSGSTFDATDADIVIGGGLTESRDKLIVNGQSSLKAKNITVGNKNNHERHSVLVANGSSLELSGAFAFGPCWKPLDYSLIVTNGASFKANSMTVAKGGYAISSTVIAVSNSSFAVTGSSFVAFPYYSSDRRCDVSFVGSSEQPAPIDFTGGLTIGAGSTQAGYTRSQPTVCVIDNAIVTVGKDVSGTTSGDMRIGQNDVAGVSDLATNRVVISGAKGCIVAKHRFVTTGTGAIEFHVPQGGYQNEYKCAIRPKQGLLANADILIDLSEVKPTVEWQEYVLVDATSDLTVNKEKISVVAPGKGRYKIVSTEKKLSVRVKANCGLIVVLR